MPRTHPTPAAVQVRQGMVGTYCTCFVDLINYTLAGRPARFCIYSKLSVVAESPVFHRDSALSVNYCIIYSDQFDDARNAESRERRKLSYDGKLRYQLSFLICLRLVIFA